MIHIPPRPSPFVGILYRGRSGLTPELRWRDCKVHSLRSRYLDVAEAETVQKCIALPKREGLVGSSVDMLRRAAPTQKLVALLSRRSPIGTQVLGPKELTNYWRTGAHRALPDKSLGSYPLKE